jgi:hypothetical protein
MSPVPQVGHRFREGTGACHIGNPGASSPAVPRQSKLLQPQELPLPFCWSVGNELLIFFSSLLLKDMLIELAV